MNKTACFDSSEERELARFYARMLSNYSMPCALLGRTMQCAYSGSSFFKEGDSLFTIASEKICCPSKDIQSIKVLIDDLSFCAMIFPVFGMDDDVKMYVCVFLDPESAMTVWVKSDASVRIRKAAYALREEVSELRASESEIRSAIKNKGELQQELWKMEKSSLNIAAGIENLIFYLQSYLSLRSFRIIDAAKFTEMIVNRCNTVLSECGRAIEYYYDKTDMLIRGDSETAVVSLVNALRNALMYSPKDTSPLLVVYKEKNGTDGEYIVFKLSNECDIKTYGSSDNPLSMDFLCRGTGLGVHIIRNFAKECNGDVDLHFEGKKAVLIMKIPAVKPKPGELHAPVMSIFDDGRQNFPELAMKQVVNFFGDGQRAVTEKSK